MPNETANLKLKLYDPDADADERVYDFIKNTTGYSNSNAMKVDTAIGQIKSDYLPLSGGRMTGSITMASGAKVVGNLDGTASLATKAVQDVDGRPIVSYYARISANAGFHNSIYRGQDITSKFNDGSLFANISNGTFDDLYIGDYFTKTCGDVTTAFRLAGFDIYYRCGDTQLTRHHAVIVPDKVLTRANMNASNITTGGYTGSRMYKETIPDLNAKLTSMVGSAHLIQYRDLLTNTTDNSVSGAYGGWTGASSNWSWTDTKCRLMNEVDVYGTRVLSSSFFDVGIASAQLPLFALNPALRVEATRDWWWISSVAHSTSFCSVNYGGDADNYRASSVNGVRPRFLIG